MREVTGGALVLHSKFWASHEHNQVLIDGEPPPAQELLRIADEGLGHLAHRRITVLAERAGDALVPDLLAAGYRHASELVMVHDGGNTGPHPHDGASTGPQRQPPVVEVSVRQVRPAIITQLRAWMPRAEPVEIEHLADRRLARRQGADEVRFLAVLDDQGEVSAWADFYRDHAHRSVAQIEDIVTAQTHVRRGYGDALLARARALAAGAESFFLLADSQDWPQHWYARRGYFPLRRVHVFWR